MCLLICLLIGVIFLIWYLNQKESFSVLGVNDCGGGYQYPPWPSDANCAGWIDYLSSGYPTISARGNQAFQMSSQDQGWMKVCSLDQMDVLASNNYAFNDAMNPGTELDVATVVGAIDGSGLSKKELCGVAKVITTPPSNQCQKIDYTNNYMSTMTPAIQTTLNKWLSYC